MDKVQKHNSFDTNTPSSESYRNYLEASKLVSPHIRMIESRRMRWAKHVAHMGEMRNA
jgi:hypothetical protein